MSTARSKVNDLLGPFLTDLLCGSPEPHHLPFVRKQGDGALGRAAGDCGWAVMQNDDDVINFIEARQWVFAKMMPQWPHECTVRKCQDPMEEQAEFEQAVVFIRADGERRTFEQRGRSSIYFDVDGCQYWTMGAPIEETVIISRAWLDCRERLAFGEGAESVEA